MRDICARVPSGARSRVLIVIAAAGALIAPACAQDEGGSPTGPTPASQVITQIDVVGPMTSPKPGDTAQFQATALLANGASRTVTALSTWDSTDTNVATVTREGVVTVVAAGEVDIRATYQGVTGSKRLTVAAAPTAPPGPPAPATFSVSGTIKDAAGGTPLAGATVTVKNAPAFALSDAKGQYRVNGMRAGTITLRVVKAGYEAVETPVAVAGDTVADVVMRKSG